MRHLVHAVWCACGIGSLGEGAQVVTCHAVGVNAQQRPYGRLCGRALFRLGAAAGGGLEWYACRPREPVLFVVRSVCADAETDSEIHLVRSGEVLNRHTIKNPMIVVCNYIFDTLRQDAFRIVEGQLQEGLCTVISDQPEPDLTNPDIIKRIR